MLCCQYCPQNHLELVIDQYIQDVKNTLVSILAIRKLKSHGCLIYVIRFRNVSWVHAVWQPCMSAWFQGCAGSLAQTRSVMHQVSAAAGGEGVKIRVESTWEKVSKIMQQCRSVPSRPCCIFNGWISFLYIKYSKFSWTRTLFYISQSDQMMIWLPLS